MDKKDVMLVLGGQGEGPRGVQCPLRSSVVILERLFSGSLIVQVQSVSKMKSFTN